MREPTLSAPEARLLDEGLSELGLELAPAQRDQLLQLSELVESWNQRFNLTGHRTRSEILVRLVLDALALSRCIPETPESVADLGAGAGFPGLPLAVVWPASEIRLVEARERRNHFQRTAIRQLGLKNAHALRGRIEELDPEPSELVVAQAVAPPSKILAAMLRWLRPGGHAVIPGSETPPAPAAHPAFRFLEIRRYQTPCGGPRRTLWIGIRE
jgi:16S rRNA (guanine527-N7)-methyltransferase